MIRKGIIIFFVFCIHSYGQKSKLPSVDTILNNAIQTFESIKDLTSEINVELQMERMQIPKMKAIMYYKKPDKIHFESDGFLFLPKEGIIWNPSILKDNYTVASCVEDTIDDLLHYKLILVAKAETAHLLKLTVWIDSKNWTLNKIVSTPYEGRTLTIDFFYILEQGKYWLPNKTIASFLSSVKSQGGYDIIDMKKQALDISQMPPLRNGTLIINYSNYKVNSGLEDSIFKNREK